MATMTQLSTSAGIAHVKLVILSQLAKDEPVSVTFMVDGKTEETLYPKPAINVLSEAMSFMQGWMRGRAFTFEVEKSWVNSEGKPMD